MSRDISSVLLSSYVNLVDFVHICYELGFRSSPDGKNVINEPFP